MSALEFTTVDLAGDVTAALAALPAGAGVAQILGPDGRNLLIGRPANLRRWTASRLGLGPPARRGARPPVDLRPVAIALRYAATATAFRQRLAYERLMARHVPLAARRDLRPPAYLHLDLGERFPRVTVRPASEGGEGLFGPFRDRRTAERARQGLHKRFPLRPCDYTFEPHRELPLGLGCLYAQVRTCAAPCLGRISEGDYRGLAREAGAWLGRPEARGADVAGWLPSWVATARGSRGLAVERTQVGVELIAVRDGCVLDDSILSTALEQLDEAVAGLRWSVPPIPPGHDVPWLLAWLHTPRRSGIYVVAEEATPANTLAGAIRAGLEAR